MKPIDHIFPERKEIMANKRCVICGGPATEFRDALSRKEYGISGMCQKCQDKVFGAEEDRKRSAKTKSKAKRKTKKKDCGCQ